MSWEVTSRNPERSRRIRSATSIGISSIQAVTLLSKSLRSVVRMGKRDFRGFYEVGDCCLERMTLLHVVFV